ncbi:hypothetical protein ABG067_004876 [Albugo candida]
MTLSDAPPIKSPCTPDEETSSTQSESSALFVGSVFEGPEKNLEIDFRVKSSTSPLGFRQVSRQELDTMLEAAKCQILSKIQNSHLDAYVLSESSLFVYANKLVLKTCGTTTLLACLPIIISAAKKLDMDIQWVGYSRKNYIFPEEQRFPHTSFTTEVAYLSQYFPNGSAHVLGPLNDDHWYIYVWDAEHHQDNGWTISDPIRSISAYSDTRSMQNSDSTLHIMMQAMNEDIAKQFRKNLDPAISSREITIKSGIRDLVPGAILDEVAFEPCGYSMNGILFDAYYTIHVTPESHCSYVSFETNARLRCYDSLLKNVVRCFQPGKFTVSVFADQNALKTLKMEIFEKDIVVLDDEQSYRRRGGHTQATFEGDYVCIMANWTLSQRKLQHKVEYQKKVRAPSFA